MAHVSFLFSITAVVTYSIILPIFCFSKIHCSSNKFPTLHAVDTHILPWLKTSSNLLTSFFSSQFDSTNFQLRLSRTIPSEVLWYRLSEPFICFLSILPWYSSCIFVWTMQCLLKYQFPFSMLYLHLNFKGFYDLGTYEVWLYMPTTWRNLQGWRYYLPKKLCFTW